MKPTFFISSDGVVVININEVLDIRFSPENQTDHTWADVRYIRNEKSINISGKIALELRDFFRNCE